MIRRGSVSPAPGVVHCAVFVMKGDDHRQIKATTPRFMPVWPFLRSD